MADLLEFLFDFIFDLITDFGQGFFRNKKINPIFRVTLAFLAFLTPLALLLLLTPFWIELDTWFIYLAVFGAELFLVYQTIKYSKGILYGFKKE